MAIIKFGTDGWRARIAEDFTFANVEIVTQALIDYLKTQSTSGQLAVLVGYDRRFLSDLFAQRVAEVFAGNGVAVDLFDTDVPTPLVSFEVKRRGLDGGVMLTASHNPPEFNGFKFKAPYGGSATPAITNQIEKLVGATAPQRLPLAEAQKQGIANVITPPDDYRRHIENFIAIKDLRNADALVIADPMHGTGGRWVERILSGGKLRVETIRAERDPLFGGVLPEPMPWNLELTSRVIRERGALMALVTDGDADRVGAMDERGEYINTHQILMILLLHLVRNKGLKGSVARTFSQSVIVKRIAESYGFRLFETPIGFKHVGELMLDPANDFLTGGEESGGIGVRGHIPERDGVFNCLLLLEAVLAMGKKPSEIIQDIWREFGEFHFERRDLHVDISAGQQLVAAMRDNTPDTFAGHKVVSVATLDGTKLFFEDESWILFRQSGTEPVLRIYCEATSIEKMTKMMDEGERLARG
ncbi:MAG TPA: phosphoglucomutase/phosphomannomutase family protein [Blastocatellia bacterium]|nr:phosphoglucomutase/phosphomannomutase family protein [Blastocatellia bacterium]HMV87315.1 phosphoglucomutase/phosphomannomutase family protein [Blastocatellia bacterium]HMX27027.1 phosphoglucomutase/phosphomannomutase family protein [Blastocatellia bacterium]HMY74160.1 phosphoglucomutase/phosphomannomutase family protein [Blastocatellia bacterium]HMZ21446.1 phosphoglucomutase/phosphomannomutase family protein [Blastocatellia bacterium]